MIKSKKYLEKKESNNNFNINLLKKYVIKPIEMIINRPI